MMTEINGGVRYNKILFINGLMVRIGVKGNINDRKMGVINQFVS